MTDWSNEHGTDQEISAGQRVCAGTAGLSGGGSGGGGLGGAHRARRAGQEPFGPEDTGQHIHGPRHR